MQTESSPPFDLSSLAAQYASQPLALRAAYTHLARWSIEATRYKDATRVMHALASAHSTGALGQAPHSANVIMSVSGLQPQQLAAIHHLHQLNTAAHPTPAGTSTSGLNQNTVVDASDLSHTERHLLIQSYKQHICALRLAWRSIRIDELAGQAAARAQLPTIVGSNGSGSNAAASRETEFMTLTDSYRSALECEILSCVNEFTSLIESRLLPMASRDETRIFYQKQCGDFYRYAAEVALGLTGVQTSPAAQQAGDAAAAPTVATLPQPVLSSVIPTGYDSKASNCYSLAIKSARACLDPTRPTRLGVALNYSVFLYEICGDKTAACELARSSFDAAIARLDDLDEASYREATLQMQLLRDNLTLWTASDMDAMQQ